MKRGKPSTMPMVGITTDNTKDTTKEMARPKTWGEP
jgi:hypothetical protein